MIKIFVNKMCCYCKNNQCNHEVEILNNNNCTTYKCNEYIKDENKIIPYEEPLFVTAPRKYIKDKEI